MCRIKTLELNMAVFGDMAPELTVVILFSHCSNKWIKQTSAGVPKKVRQKGSHIQ